MTNEQKLIKARNEYVRLYVADISAHPEVYKDHVVAAPEENALEVIDGLDLHDTREMLKALKEELRAIA